MNIEQIQKLIIDVPDFPKAGVVFKDITPVLSNPAAFQSLAKHLAERVSKETSHLVAMESRGFILGAAVAQYCQAGLVLARKPGKLPRATKKETYSLEYGTDSIEIHQDAFPKGAKVTIIDDVLATGGTACATEKLCEGLGAHILGSLFLLELGFLNGSKKLKNPHQSLIVVS